MGIITKNDCFIGLNMTKMIYLSNILFWFPSMKNEHKKIKVSLTPASVAYVVLEKHESQEQFQPLSIQSQSHGTFW